MWTREEAQARMLDHLYGLLDEQETAWMESALAADPDLRAYCEQQKNVLGLIAKAAKLEFPEVTFKTPESAQAAVVVPARSDDGTPPTTAPIRGNGAGWTRWAVAAVLLLVIGGLGTPAGLYVLGINQREAQVAQRQQEFEAVRTRTQAEHDAATAAARSALAPKQQQLETLRKQVREIIDRLNDLDNQAERESHAAELRFQQDQAAVMARLDRLRKEEEDAVKEVSALQVQFNEQLAKARQSIAEKELYVRLSGPESIAAGAFNEFKIQTLDAKHQYTKPQKLIALLRDASGKEIWRAPEMTNLTEPPTLRLPPDLPLKPGMSLSLEVLAVTEKGGESVVCQPIRLDPPLWVTFLTSDKPMYKPGETIRFRSVTLDRASFLPPSDDLHLEFTLTNPKGEEVYNESGSARVDRLEKDKFEPILGPDGKPVRGIACGSYDLDANAPGGEYLLTVNQLLTKTDAKNVTIVSKRRLGTKKLLVNVYRPDRLNKKLEFDGKTYGRGDIVMAKVEAELGTGGKLVNVPVTVRAVVDGQEIKGISVPAKTDANGVVFVRLQLPEKIERGEASLSVTFNDPAGAEAIVRPIPVVGSQLDVQFYPEGGDLVAGLPNRVYFQAKTPLGKPADLQGVITDGTKVVAEVRTLTDPDHPGANQGQGVFAFTPEAGKKYTLEIKKPLGIDSRPVLPIVKAEGVVLKVATGDGAAARGVFAANEAIRATVAFTGGPPQRTFLVGAYCRGRLLAHERIENLKAGEAKSIDLGTDAPLGGVVRVTVFEVIDAANGNFKPVAERLVFRRPPQELKLRTIAGKPGQPNLGNDAVRFVPGEKVQLQITATNEKDEPTPAILMVAVVNQSVITMADDKKARQMPAHFLVAGEIREPDDLEHADFFLTEHPQAVAALDLLLGTQGWRRFAEVDPKAFERTHPEDANSLFARTGQMSRSPIETLRQEEEKLVASLLPKYEVAQDRLQQVQLQMAALHEKTAQAQADLQNDLQKREAEFEQARAALRTKLNGLRPEFNKASTEVAAAQQVLDTESAKAWAIINPQRVAANAPLEKAKADLNAYRRDWETRKGWLFPLIGTALVLIGVLSLVLALRRAQVGEGIPYFATATGAFVTCALVLVTGFLTIDSPPTGAARMAVGEATPEASNRSDADFVRSAPTSARKPTTRLAAQVGDEGKGAGLAEAGSPAADPFAQELDRGLRFEKQLAGAAGQFQRFNGQLGRGGLKPAAAMPDGIPMLPAAPGGFGAAVPMLDGAAIPPAFRKDDVVPRRAGVDAKNLNAKAAEDRLRQLDKANREREMIGEIRKQAQSDLSRLRDQRKQLAHRGLMQGELRQNARIAGRDFAPGMPGMPGMPGKPPVPNPGMHLPNMKAMPPHDPVIIQELEAVLASKLMPFVVREFAFQRQPLAGNPSEMRTDFSETLVWQPILVLPQGGQQTLTFDLADDLTRYQVLVAGHTLDGRIGSQTSEIIVTKPFSLTPKLPTEINSNDKLDVSIRIVNDSNDPRPVRFSITPTGLNSDSSKTTSTTVEMPKEPYGPIQDSIRLNPMQRTQRLYRFAPSIKEGLAALKVEGESTPGTPSDSSEVLLKVLPEGFPATGSVSDLLEQVARPEIHLPPYIPGTLKLTVNVYPSTLADLQKGLEGMLREPGGCFEQTSSSSYPNTMILDYLKVSDQASPETSKRAKELLERGYGRLIGFECLKDTTTKEGYEWFGGRAAPHEALTAYGLLQFKDMARHYPVDPEMLKRTQQYLLSRRDGQGGFERNVRALDTFGRAPQHITNAYIVWALTESDPDDKEKMDLSKEIAHLKKDAFGEYAKDPYYVALVANILLNRSDRDGAIDLLKKLAEGQTKTGYIPGATTSITGSGGNDLLIETSALTILGWLKANDPKLFHEALNGDGKKDGKVGAIKWLSQQRGGYGGFGSTQSTIMALKALIAFTIASKRPTEDGDLRLYLGDELLDVVSFTKETREVISIDLPPQRVEPLLKPGKHTLTVKLSTKTPFPFSLSWSCSTLQPTSSEKPVVKLATTLLKPTVKQGETVGLKVKVENTTDNGYGMTTAILGIPAGLKVPEDMKQLTKLREDGVISFFEFMPGRSRELVIYWRDLAPKSKRPPVEFTLDLIAEHAGEFRGQASRAYLYYNAADKHWVEPLAVTVQPNLGDPQ